MHKYEIMFILKADLEDEARNATIDQLKAILTRDNGTVDNVDEWGLKDFAYEINHMTKGYYVVVDTTTAPANISEFERISRINTNVIRYLSLRRD